MYRYDKELGLVYDTLAFLSVYLGGGMENGPDSIPGDSEYYLALKQNAEHDNIIIPQYLYTFCGAPASGKCSYLLDVILHGIPYSECTLQRVLRDLQNKSYSKTRFTEYAAAQTDRAKIRALRDLEHPAAYEVLNDTALTPNAKADLMYALLRYDEVMTDLCAAIQGVYDTLNRILPEDGAFPFKSDGMMDKLAVIGTGGRDKNAGIVFSISHLNPRHLSYQQCDPVFFLLGCDAGDRLGTEYKYACATPLDFAQAVSTPVKYDIFRAFLEHGSLSAPELMMIVNQSRNSIRYSVSDMVGRGVLVIDRIKGQTHYYKLDKEYIRFIARQLYTISN